jgi:hypothetical protein
MIVMTEFERLYSIIFFTSTDLGWLVKGLHIILFFIRIKCINKKKSFIKWHLKSWITVYKKNKMYALQLR